LTGTARATLHARTPVVALHDLAVDEVPHVVHAQLAAVELERELADGLRAGLARGQVQACTRAFACVCVCVCARVHVSSEALRARAAWFCAGRESAWHTRTHARTHTHTHARTHTHTKHTFMYECRATGQAPSAHPPAKKGCARAISAVGRLLGSKASSCLRMDSALGSASGAAAAEARLSVYAQVGEGAALGPLGLRHHRSNAGVRAHAPSATSRGQDFGQGAAPHRRVGERTLFRRFFPAPALTGVGEEDLEWDAGLGAHGRQEAARLFVADLCVRVGGSTSFRSG